MSAARDARDENSRDMCQEAPRRFAGVVPGGCDVVTVNQPQGSASVAFQNGDDARVSESGRGGKSRGRGQGCWNGLMVSIRHSSCRNDRDMPRSPRSSLKAGRRRHRWRPHPICDQHV